MSKELRTYMAVQDKSTKPIPFHQQAVATLHPQDAEVG
jgi:hypothetical protein